MKNLKRILLCSLVPLIVMTLAITRAQEQEEDHHGPPHWSYQGENGPLRWSSLDPSFSSCKFGHQQSPVDIRKSKKYDLDPIEFDYHPSPLNVIDNGHTIMVTYAPGSSITVAGHHFVLKQFHFHHPSEEKINGKASDMVVHLVHADIEGKLGVVAVFLKVGRPNSVIQTIWQHLPKKKNVATKIDTLTIDATELLPSDRGYYNFMGSLTTPPCTESVEWFILKSPSTLSADEVNAFAKLYPMNARPTQPVYNRFIRETR